MHPTEEWLSGHAKKKKIGPSHYWNIANTLCLDKEKHFSQISERTKIEDLQFFL
jgi:hypothetical protein